MCVRAKGRIGEQKKEMAKEQNSSWHKRETENKKIPVGSRTEG